MLAEWLEWCTETVTVHLADGGHDRYGRRTESGTATYAARIERDPHLVRNAEGHEVVASATFFVDSTGITPSDRVTHDGEVLDIIRISTVTDETGAVSHQELSVA